VAANAVSSSDQPKISMNMKSLGVRPKSWVIMVDKNGAGEKVVYEHLPVLSAE
jgi:hypothetical protein